MRKISFNKIEEMVVCRICRTTKVPKIKAMIKCENCKSKRTVDAGIGISNRQPAAIIQTESGEKVFVDAHGKEVEGHGYDLKNDPKGYKKQGLIKERTII